MSHEDILTWKLLKLKKFSSSDTLGVFQGLGGHMWPLTAKCNSRGRWFPSCQRVLLDGAAPESLQGLQEWHLGDLTPCPAPPWPKTSLVHRCAVSCQARLRHTRFLSMKLWEATGNRIGLELGVKPVCSPCLGAAAASGVFREVTIRWSMSAWTHPQCKTRVQAESSPYLGLQAAGLTLRSGRE